MPVIGKVGICALSLAIISAPAFGALRAVSPLPGYQCMVLNLSEKEAMDFNFHVPVRAEPVAGAPAVGWAGAIVAVRDPRHVVNGFAEALFPTGATVWIASNMLRPYQSPGVKCVPSLMSNGKPGFAFPHS
jgi:hypothetical protein